MIKRQKESDSAPLKGNAVAIASEHTIRILVQSNKKMDEKVDRYVVKNRQRESERDRKRKRERAREREREGDPI